MLAAEVYLHSALHIRYNTGLSFAGVGFAPWPERIEQRRLPSGAVVDSSAAFPTFGAIATAITLAGGPRPSARCFSTAFARARRARLRLLRERRRLPRARSAPRGRLPDGPRMRAPCACRKSKNVTWNARARNEKENQQTSITRTINLGEDKKNSLYMLDFWKIKHEWLSHLLEVSGLDLEKHDSNCPHPQSRLSAMVEIQVPATKQAQFILSGSNIIELYIDMRHWNFNRPYIFILVIENRYCDRRLISLECYHNNFFSFVK